MADLDFGKSNFTSETMISGKNLLNLQQNYKQIETQKLKKKLNNYKSLSHVSQPTLQNQNKQLRVKKCLTRLNFEEIVPSSRKYPFINFKAEREIGNDLLTVENLSVKIDGETILDNISFILRPGDKTALIGQNDIQTTALIRALMDDIEYEGTVKWGVTTSRSYLPKEQQPRFCRW